VIECCDRAVISVSWFFINAQELIMQGFNSKIPAMLLLLITASQSHAEWALDGNASSFFYVTTKAAAVTEVNSFSGLSGSISDNGKASFMIDLATVDTTVEVRDQRMRDVLFQVAKFPSAMVTVDVDAEALDNMSAGVSITGRYTAEVALHGMTQDLMADLQITKLEDDSILVQVARPLIVSASAFGLQAGVDELQKVAALPSITPGVVVDFTLVYRKQ
jgi:polyisoprenoid-binding protein YceI